MMAKNLNKNAGKRQKMFSLIAIHGQFCFQKELQYEKWWLIPCTSKVFFLVHMLLFIPKEIIEMRKEKNERWCSLPLMLNSIPLWRQGMSWRWWKAVCARKFSPKYCPVLSFCSGGEFVIHPPPVKSDDSQSPNHSLFCCLSFFSVFSNCKIHPQKKTMEKMKFSFVFFMSVWPC